MKSYREKHEPVALVTVTKCLGSTPSKVGARMIVTTEKKIHGTIGGGKLEFQILDEALMALRENRIIETTYKLGPEFKPCCGGKVELIIEPMNLLPELFVFGAGHIGIELCTLLKDTPFKVNLIDSREGWIGQLELEDHINAIQVDESDFKTFSQAVHWGPNCYIMVMTHDHAIDFEIIAMALKQETRYIGLIGSKTKRVRFHNLLIKELSISQGMDNVICPIGLEIGGNSPKEIAISAAAQLLQIKYS